MNSFLVQWRRLCILTYVCPFCRYLQQPWLQQLTIRPWSSAGGLRNRGRQGLLARQELVGRNLGNEGLYQDDQEPEQPMRDRFLRCISSGVRWEIVLHDVLLYNCTYRILSFEFNIIFMQQYFFHFWKFDPYLKSRIGSRSPPLILKVFTLRRRNHRGG